MTQDSVLGTERPPAVDGVLTLMPFLSLVRELGGVLVPLQPRPLFREELHHSLVKAARHQYAQMMLDVVPPGVDAPAGSGRRWVLGAAVGSAVSLGLAAYFWRQRGQRAA